MKQLNQFFASLQEKNWRALLALFLVTFAVHSPVLFNGYNLDDELVTRNHSLTSKGIPSILEIYQSAYYEDEMGYSYGYRPTVLASFAIEHQLFGESPFVGHFINLLLFALTVIVIFKLILFLLSSHWWLAFGTAILFALHPIHIEVVASLKNRDELLSVLFALSAIRFGLIGRFQQNIGGILLALALIFFSLTSKFSGLYIILWIPPLLIHQKTHPVKRVLLYGGIASIFHLIYSLRQSSSDHLLYTISILLTLGAFDVFSMIFGKLKSLGLRRSMAKVSKLIGSPFLRVSKKLKSAQSVFFEQADDYLWVPFYVGSRRSVKILKAFWTKASELVFRSQVIIDVDKHLFLSAIAILAAFWNPLAFVGLLLLPRIWDRMNERQRSFARDFELPVIVLSALITATNLFTPFVVAFFFGKKFLLEKKISTTGIVVGFSIWSIFMGIDVFVIGDTYELNDLILYLFFITLLFSQVLVRLIFNSVNQTRNLIAQIFIGLSLALLLQGLLNSIEYTSIFILLNTLIALGVVSNRFRKPTASRSTVRIASAIAVIYAIFSGYSYTTEWLKDRPNVDYKLRWESQSVSFQVRSAKSAFDFVWQSAISTERASNIIKFHVRDKLNYLKNYQDPVSLEDAYLSADSGERVFIETNNRPLEFIENPIAYYGSPTVKYASAIVNTTWFLQKSVVPYPQSFYYGYNEIPSVDILHAQTIVKGLLLLTLLLLSVILLFKEGMILFSIGLLFATGSAMFFSGAFESLPGVLADRFVYIPSLGICFGIAGFGHWFLNTKQNSKRTTLITFLFTVVLIGFSVLSIERSLLWQDKVTLMRHDIRNVPNSAQAHNLLAHALMEQVFEKSNKQTQTEKEQQIVEAKGHFDSATEIYPLFFNAWVDKGKVNELLNEPEEAIASFKKALSIDSSYTPLISWIGKNFELLGNYYKATEYYQKHLLQRPNDFVNYDNLARVLFRQNKFDEAISVCEEYLKIDPNNQIFIDNIAFMKQQMENADSLESNAE